MPIITLLNSTTRRFSKFPMISMPNKASSSSSSSSWKNMKYSLVSKAKRPTKISDHLHDSLTKKGIYTFKDDEKLGRRKPISSELLKAIEESWFAIIVLSDKYASSAWCLDKLAKIVECMEKLGLTILSDKYASSAWCLDELAKIVECMEKLVLTILPVFHQVEPTCHVRKQRGDFGKAFDKHEQVFKRNVGKVVKRREALKEVGGISGWMGCER